MSNLVAVDDIPVERLSEICRAEQEGRLVILPCKVGDAVWCLCGRFGSSIEQDKCCGFYYSNHEFLIKVECARANHATYPFLGKTVFLTQEAAEQALDKRKTAL